MGLFVRRPNSAMPEIQRAAVDLVTVWFAAKLVACQPLNRPLVHFHAKTCQSCVCHFAHPTFGAAAIMVWHSLDVIQTEQLPK
jgi:hypothetical protein